MRADIELVLSLESDSVLTSGSISVSPALHEYIVSVTSDVESGIWSWVLTVSKTLGVQVPCLMGRGVTVLEDDMSVVGITSAVNFEALVRWVSQTLISAAEVGQSLVGFTDPLSDDNSSVDVELSTELVGDCVVSPHLWSDSSSSLVEEPPLLSVVW